MDEITQLLSALQHDDPHAAGQLLPLVYDELRQLAARRLAREKPGQTLEPTGLVHEAYLRLVGTGDPHHPEAHWANRHHFFAAAAEAMRRILVDRARQKATLKRGGGRRMDLDTLDLGRDEHVEDVVALSDALDVLANHDPRAAQLVKLRYFAGLSHQEAAATLGVSRGAADRLWVVARAWLYQQLNDPPE